MNNKAMEELHKKGKVVFIGAGPGDPELMTIKGHKIIATADMVVYAGSLVSPEIARMASPDAKVYDSSTMTLEECCQLMIDEAISGGLVARVHTGDPSLYGAMPEQAALLEAAGVEWEVIPGITAANAAAAAGGISFTLPEISQSLVLTRLAGRTPMPDREALSNFARMGVPMAIYLAGHASETVQQELEKYFDAETPVFCAHKVGWPQQKLVWCALKDLHAMVLDEGMRHQTIFLVLPHALNEKKTVSRLYSAEFSHSRRSGKCEK